MTDSAVYRAWQQMRMRVKSSPNYKDVKVCDRWLAFENFFADMGDRPNVKNASLGRIDNLGDYEPTNCKWETPKEQNSNKGDTLLIASQQLGTRTRTEWAFVLLEQTRDTTWTPARLKTFLKAMTIDQILRGLEITDISPIADNALERPHEFEAA